MILLLVFLVLAAVSLWSVSVGAWLEVQRERDRDLDALCPAWVPLAGGDQLYRCGARPAAGGEFCPTHASPSRRNAAATHPDADRVEHTRQWADARRQMRWGLPLAVMSAIATVAALVVWT